MIDKDRYIRMVIHMEQDIDFLSEHLKKFKTVLRNVFGIEVYKKCENKLDMLKSNVNELRQDLKDSGLL